MIGSELVLGWYFKFYSFGFIFFIWLFIEDLEFRRIFR